MELNDKKLQRTSKIIYYAISILLCGFLILLSSRIIDDLDGTTTMPITEDFENKTVLNKYNQQLNNQTAAIENLNTKKNTIQKTVSLARANYNNEKQSFDNWLETRKTLGSPDKDTEVILRAKKLDEFYKIEQDWRLKFNALDEESLKIEKKKTQTQKIIDKETENTYAKYNQGLKKYELKLFLIRLLFVAPILFLGIFFFIKYRKNKYWPLYFGFTLFSLYAFFIGLLPYLPSYGGYVRYSVGIILSGGLGYYAIKKIREFIERKQAELKISTEERSKKIEIETAEKALANHFCPSCGKDFIIKKWEFPVVKNLEENTYKLVTNFCRHCGLELFKNCTNCGNKNFAHLPFCSSCGTGLSTNKLT